MTSRSLGAAVLTAVALLAGCAGSSADPSAAGSSSTATSAVSPSTTTAAPIDPATKCSQQPGAHGVSGLTIDSPSGASLNAAEAGTGTRGVVIVGGSFSSQGWCYWWPTLGMLADAGFHVLAFNERCSKGSTCSDEIRPVDDVYAAVAELRSRGAERVVVVGGSDGGASAILAATRGGAGADAAVALSAYRIEVDTRAVDTDWSVPSEAAAHVAMPILYMIAEDDIGSTVSAQTRMAEAASSGLATLSVVGADGGHAQQMLYTDHTSTELTPQAHVFLDFLTQHTGG